MFEMSIANLTASILIIKPHEKHHIYIMTVTNLMDICAISPKMLLLFI